MCFDSVAKLTKKEHSPREYGLHFSNVEFMNFDEKIMIIRKQIRDSLNLHN
jgi:hypothetical protein